MRAFLIDFENVKSAGLVGIETLGIDDQVVILYSANSNTISFEMHQKIMTCEANVEYYQIRRGGKNSLDFQLSSLLGFLLASGLYTHLYVISNDSGFDALYDFWTSQYIPTDSIVYRRANIAAAVAHSAFHLRQNVPMPDEVEVDVTTDDSGAYDHFGMDEAETVETVEIDVEEVVEEAADEASEPIDEANEPAEPETEVVEEISDPMDDEETAALLAVMEAVREELEETIDPPVAIVPSAEAEEPVEEPKRRKRTRSRRGKASDKSDKNDKGDKTEKNEPEAAKAEAAEPAKAEDLQLAAIMEKLAAELGDVCNEEQRAAVAREILSSEGKQEFYRAIIRRFGQKKGLVVYKAVKSDYSMMRKK